MNSFHSGGRGCRHHLCRRALGHGRAGRVLCVGRRVHGSLSALQGGRGGSSHVSPRAGGGEIFYRGLEEKVTVAG